jgi:hypothetical protein
VDPAVKEYRVLRRLDGEADFREIGRSATTTFTDPDAEPRRAASYRVDSFTDNVAAEGATGAEATLPAVVPPRPPEIGGALGTLDSITLRWSNPPGAVYFRLYRAEGKDGETALLGELRTDVYTDRAVSRGKAYLYRVSAVGKDGAESERSAPVPAKLREPSVGGGGKDVRKDGTVPRTLNLASSFQGEEYYELDSPSDLVVTRSGELLVLDRKGVQFFDRDCAFNRRITFDRRWSAPGGLALDRDGWILVPFFDEHLVRKFDDRGKLIRTIRLRSGREGEAIHPNSIAADDRGNYWIVDGTRSQLVKVRGDGKILQVIGRVPGTYPRGTAVESDLPGAMRVQFNPMDKRLYVVLGPSSTVKVVDPARGRVTGSFGTIGKGPGRFHGIGGLAFRTRDGAIFVLDHLLQVIQEFSADLQYRGTWVDVIEPERVRLSTNLLTAISLDEGKGRFFLSSALGGWVYALDMVEGGKEP